MNIEKAIDILKSRSVCMECVISKYDCDACDEAFEMAISALEQEPCDDMLKINKSALKSRIADKVVYNVEWLKKHWQTEMEIVCGVKPCDDAISRADAIKALQNVVCTSAAIKSRMVGAIEELPSVQPSRAVQI